MTFRKKNFFYRIGEWETGKATVSYQVINSTLPQTITPFEYTSTFFEILTNAISTSENEKMKMFPAAMVQKKSKNLESARYVHFKKTLNISSIFERFIHMFFQF